MRSVRRFAVVVAALTAACSTGATAPEISTSPASTSTTPPATTSTSTTAPTTTTTSVPAAFDPGPLQSLLDDPAGGSAFSGVVLIGRGEEILWTYAAGAADRERGIANQPDTRFNLMSMTKMFTAVAVMSLVEDGLLALDGTIGEYLPDYPNAAVASAVTIEQLLSHTGGLGDTFIEEFGEDPHAYRSDADYLPLFVDDPLLFPPGEEFRYSNAGFAVLGLIVAEVSGRDVHEYLDEVVYGPAGMASSGAPFIEEVADDLAIGYTTRDIDGNETGVLSPNTALMPGRGFAAGGTYSTAGDLHRFAAALMGGRLVDPSSVDLLITGRVRLGEHASYGLGFFDRIQWGERVVGHGGGAPGGCTSLSIYPDTGYTAVVLSNSDSDCLAVLDFLASNPPG